MTYRHTPPPQSDKRVHYICALLTFCSMCLSAYFGYSMGENVWPFNWLLAAMCAIVAYAVAVAFENAAYFHRYGARKEALNWWVAGVLFLVFNSIADYSSAAALRDAVAVHASNQNNQADDVRTQIKLVEKNIADAKATVAWQSSLLPAASYEAEISNLSGNQTIMQRSKNCADQTREDTKSHCQKLSAAKANLGMANQKAAYEIQVVKWEEELKELKVASANTQFESNPVLAPIKAIVSMVKRDRNLTEDNIAWGGLGLMLITTVLVNFALAVCGNYIGKNKAEKEIAFADAEADAQRPIQHLAYHGPRDDDRQSARNPEPIPLKPAPSHGRDRETVSETVIIQQGPPAASPSSENPDIKELLQRSQDAAARAREMLAQMKAAGRA